MILADKNIIKLLSAFVVSCRLSMRGPWLFLVSASSGGKSMLLEALQGCNNTHVIDDLTPATMASGMKGKHGEDNSLLSQFTYGSILIIKDFTTILSKDKEVQKAIVGQLRKIYDGDYVKRYGNGQNTDWHGKVSILAGVTSKVHTTMHQLTHIG